MYVTYLIPLPLPIMSIQIHYLLQFNLKTFFLECAGELRINILRRMKRGERAPKTKMLQG